MVAGAPTRVLVLGRNGRFAAHYDKQHPTPSERAAGFSPGTSGCTLTVDGWRLGLGICWDSGYPEHARVAALDGCHTYPVGAMFGRGAGAHQRATVFPARALDNTSYVPLANHSGPSGPYHGCGGSAVWNPDGTLLVNARHCRPRSGHRLSRSAGPGKVPGQGTGTGRPLTQRPHTPPQRYYRRLRPPQREPGRLHGPGPGHCGSLDVRAPAMCDPDGMLTDHHGP
ncbi:carbon-nitrogen hydrolase family protein [Streptomyces gelaticus]|uniref:carbon-nitrogen hydrolase family protein n=1 Tax=Streptomyces gelaticus TaxID=285446 RepID=UPI00167AD24F